MFKEILWCFVAITSIYNVDSRFRSDYNYIKEANGWLKLHQVPATFNDAFFRCDQEGSVLASPYDVSLQNAFKQMYPKTKQSCPIYVGIHATISRGDYTSIEGIPLSQIPVEWAPGEPQDYSKEEGCLIMLNNGYLAGTMCNETYPYFCFKKNTSDLIMNECGTIDPGYSFDISTGRCYKFHRDNLSWRDAYSMCLAEGAYLAIINSDLEAQVLKQLFDKADIEAANDVYKIKETNPDLASVGILDWAGSGRWYTIHGQKLRQAGYSKWAGGQPDNSTNINVHGELCGSFVKTGLLNDVPCENLYLRFICEKDPITLTLEENDIIN